MGEEDENAPGEQLNPSAQHQKAAGTRLIHMR
jgi:hypothetical protein